ncbi:MAG: hypothetical protein GY841_23555 [FCB group bacterium]|nr:hypothetical protein [FCB group bacterium]
MGMFDFQNESQAAFDLSQREHVSHDESWAADYLTRWGYVVVCINYLVHCRLTDAVICEETGILQVYDTSPDMRAEYGDDLGHPEAPYIYSLPEPIYPDVNLPICNDEHIPF